MVVTRFAPSPTGYLHIGGARTAIFNWLWARHKGGKFILRIEDTDAKRSTEAAMTQVLSDLQWLGLQWDEGPQIGGPNGPYLQSQRKDIYDKYIDQLIELGRAYYCFDTPEDIQKMREAAAAKKQNFLYPRPEKFPSKQDAENAADQGKPVTVRMIMPDKPAVVEDLVRGTVTFAPDQLSDFIIKKSDGMPTYNFAVVIDDALMKVTHIIRGQEHLMNTPYQQAIQDALELPRPTYAHMSVTVSDSGGKLSKRERPETLRKAIKSKQDIDPEALAESAGLTKQQLDDFIAGKSMPDMPVIDAMAEKIGVHLPEINVVDFFRSGYLPEALLNFTAILGWTPAHGKEIMQAEQLVESFDLARLTKSNSLFDRKKLLAFNTEHMRLVLPEKLLEHMKKYLEAIDSPVAQADDELLAHLLEINAGARTLADIELKCRFLFCENEKIQYDPKAVKKVLLKKDAQGLKMLHIVRQKLADLAKLEESTLEHMLRGLAEDYQVGLGKVAQPLRVAMTGTTVSPPIFESIKLLGRENTLARIDITIEKFTKAASDEN